MQSHVMTSQTETCNCPILNGMPIGHESSLNKSKPMYQTEIMSCTQPDWNLIQQKLHRRRHVNPVYTISHRTKASNYQAYVYINNKDTASNLMRLKLNSVRSTSLSSEHLHQDSDVVHLNPNCYKTNPSQPIQTSNDHVTSPTYCTNADAHRLHNVKKKKNSSPNQDNANLFNVSYELSQDLRAKEVEFMERCYGGRMRAHRAAKLIQSKYRDYRLRSEYARLRLGAMPQGHSACSCSRKPDQSSTAKVGTSSFVGEIQLIHCPHCLGSIATNPPTISVGSQFAVLSPSQQHHQHQHVTYVPVKVNQHIPCTQHPSTAAAGPFRPCQDPRCPHTAPHFHVRRVQSSLQTSAAPRPQMVLDSSGMCWTQLPQSPEKRRKRTYRIGLNLFNKYVQLLNSFGLFSRSPVKGIDFLMRNEFLDDNAQLVGRFLLNRKGLSRVAIGDYLGNTKDPMAIETTKHFMRELDFRELDVDEALRRLLCCFRTPGESQKIVHLLTEFQAVYLEQNAVRVEAQFKNSDSIMILAYAIVMLHTDMYSPNVRVQSKMSRDEFVRNLRGVDGGNDLDRNMLLSIYDRIQANEMSVLPDHTDQVRKIQQHLTGPLKPLNLSIPQRRLVCYCRLFEVNDRNKRDRVGAHQREVFLFNDMLIITKAVQKKRRDASVAYQVRMCIHLLGLEVGRFETHHYSNGLELTLAVNKFSNLSPSNQSPSVVCLNTKTHLDRERLLEDLHECILEVTEMDRLRLEDEIAKQQRFGACPLTDGRSPNSMKTSSPNESNGAKVTKHGMMPDNLDFTVDSVEFQEIQRLSGDSGLLVDLDTPTNQSSGGGFNTSSSDSNIS